MTASAGMLSVFSLLGKWGSAQLAFLPLLFFRFLIPLVLIVPFLFYGKAGKELSYAPDFIAGSRGFGRIIKRNQRNIRGITGR